MLSHFDSNATEGAAADFIKKYTDKFGTDTLNQFGASAYDCVYAIYNAMKAELMQAKKLMLQFQHLTFAIYLKHSSQAISHTAV